MFQNKKILEVFVEKGMAEGQIIKFRGEADQEFGKDAGDVVIVLIVKDHDKFTRKGGGRRSFMKQAMVIYYDLYLVYKLYLKLFFMDFILKCKMRFFGSYSN